MIMLDDNNLEIADILMGWATSRDLNLNSARKPQSEYQELGATCGTDGEEHRRF